MHAAPLESHGRGNFRVRSDASGQMWRRLLAEAVGTFALTFVAAGGPVFGAAMHGAVGRSAAVVAPALVVVAMIYTLGDVSGAHLNPVVTLAFAVRTDFPWKWLPGYWLAQLLAGVAAAGALRALAGTAGHLGATLPTDGSVRALAVEAILTWLLVTVILGTSSGHKVVGHNAALAVGGYIALAGLFASPISGASMNPARSFGPDLLGPGLGTFWIYVAGPTVGALAAVVLAKALHGAPSLDEERAAGWQGSGNSPSVAPSLPHATSEDGNP